MSDTRFLALAGGRIAYQDTETDGPTVLAVPGMGESKAVYRFLRPLLVAAGYRVVTMDLRGCGESTARWDDYRTVAVAGDIIDTIRTVCGGPVSLLTHSYTGGPGFLVAARAPELVNSLVMIDTVGRPQPKLNPLLKPAEWLVSHFAIGWVTYWSTLFKLTRPADYAQARATLLANMREPGRMAALRAMMADPQEAGAAVAAEVRCPVLVLMGTKDTDFPKPAEEARALAGMVPNGRFELVEGAGHYPQIEVPDVVAGSVLPFLARSLVRTTKPA